MQVVSDVKPVDFRCWKGQWYSFENGEMVEVPADFPVQNGIKKVEEVKDNSVKEEVKAAEPAPAIPAVVEPVQPAVAVDKTRPRRRR